MQTLSNANGRLDDALAVLTSRSLCEMGVNPEALANIVKELQQLKANQED